MSEAQKTTGEFNVSERDQEIITALLVKTDEAHYQTDGRIAVITRTALANLLSDEEIGIVDRVYSIDPTRYGFKAPKLAIEPVPDKLIRVPPRPYTYDTEEYFTYTQYVPEAPYRAFQVMARAALAGIGRELLINSSYRSPDYQALTFLDILRVNKFDVPTTARRAAIPGYSEHGTPSSLALDIQNVDGLPSDETPQDFEGTVEYDWLVANAHNYGFFMSYPRDNPHGVMFEPWHWRHVQSGNP